MYSYFRVLIWVLFGGILVFYIDCMYFFNNIKCLVYVRYCFGDIMVNNIDKIFVVMEINDIMLENKM